MVRGSTSRLEKDYSDAPAATGLAVVRTLAVSCVSCIAVAGCESAPPRPESETCLSVLWSGNTWNFRNALDEAGVKGAYVDEEGGEGDNAGKRKYFRILKSIDATEETKKIQNVLKEVFQNLAMKVIVESEPVEDSDVAELIEELRKVPSLHFEK